MSIKFSASSAGRLMHCPAAAHLEKAIENWAAPVVDPTTGAKSEGTRKHNLIEPLMNLSARDLAHMAKLLDYVSAVRSRRRFSVLAEHPVMAAWLQTQPMTTADLVLYVQDEIHIFDWKWGRIPVDPTDNSQLLFYAACYAGLAPRAKGVHLHLLQPPLDVYESWFADTNVIKKFMSEARAAEAKILAGDTTFGPSDHCTFCPANPHGRGDKGRPFCPALMQIHYPSHVDEDEILSL